MSTWMNSGMTLAELIEEYVNKRRSLAQICRERGICKGAAGMGGMSMALQRAGYAIRNRSIESAEKRRITKENMWERLGISWDELVEWYKARKSFSSLCAKYGLGSQRSVIFKRLLVDGGIIDTNPLRGYGFTEEELVKMYVDEDMSMQQIYAKFNLGRAAERVVSSILRKRGVHKWGEDCFNKSPAKYVAADGYVRVHVTAENAKFTIIQMGDYDMEHRLVVATSIGRPLERHEYIHHINRDGTDNRLSNLMLVDRNTHKRIHVSMDGIIEELFKEGIVALSGDKEYVLRESDEYTRGFVDGMQAILEMD